MDISSNSITNIIAGLSLFVAAVTMIFYFRDRRREKFNILKEYRHDVLQWYSETIEILLELKRLTVLGKTEEKNCFLSKLSAQIEKGRFFFPNIDLGDKFGKEKPTAFQGYRSLSLDFLVYSFNLYSENNAKEKLPQIKKLHREFTSIIFEVVNPQNYLTEIKKLTGHYFASQKIFEDYLQETPESFQLFLNRRNKR